MSNYTLSTNCQNISRRPLANTSISSCNFRPSVSIFVIPSCCLFRRMILPRFSTTPPYISHAVPFLAPPLYVLSPMFAHLAVLAALPIVDGPLYISNFLPQLPRDILRVSEVIYNACLSCNHLLVASTFHPTKPTSQLIVSHPVHVPRVFTLSF